jgi:dipeptidyl aminopeptidase/acylaminoacyl peptidase
MSSDRDWHDLLEAAVPRPQPSPDALRRLDEAIAARRRRMATTAVPIGTAVAVGAVIAAIGLFSPGNGGAGPATVGGSPPAHTSGWLPAGSLIDKCGNTFCSMRADGSDRRTEDLTFPEWDPAWSPDGQSLAFRGYRNENDGSYAVYVASARDCVPHRIAGTSGGYEPTWAPNGKQVAFALGGIHVVNLDGSNPRTVTAPSGAVDTAPSWSAGNRIAFVRTERGHAAGQVYVVDGGGGRPRRLTEGPDGHEQPAWSPDGSRLATVAKKSDAGGRIVVLGRHGRAQQVSPQRWTAFSPTWTPDGRIVFLRVVYPAGQAQATAAYVVRPDGRGLHLLYSHLGGAEGSALQVAWTPAQTPLAGCS